MADAMLISPLHTLCVLFVWPHAFFLPREEPGLLLDEILADLIFSGYVVSLSAVSL
jgi:hypothetical protein